jgi:tetratricopeptide (TPR) repeat protein
LSIAKGEEIIFEHRPHPGNQTPSVTTENKYLTNKDCAMKLTSVTSHAIFGICLNLSLALGISSGLAARTSNQAPRRQTPPPEQAEYAAARDITELPDRIKAFERLKAAYPDSTLRYVIDYNLLESLSNNADTFDKLLAGQRDVLASCKPWDRFFIMANAAKMLVNHSKFAEFPREAALKAIQDYKAEAMLLLNSPESGRAAERRRMVANNYKIVFEIPLTKVLLLNSKGQEALDVLEAYRKTTSPSADYYVALGETYRELKRDKDALDTFFEAAVTGSRAAIENARVLYAKINGSSADFDNELALRRARLPFQPPTFKAPEKWSSRTVLAEVFTGAECNPCVAAGFAFDALEESYPTRYLAVLKYHLPIPHYDPMINPATKKRQDYYGKEIIKGTPTAIIDGLISPSVGGDRMRSSIAFYNAKKDIDAAMSAAVDITLKANASIDGDDVKVDCEFSKVIVGADYNVVLVQTKEDFKGGNGIVRHNMIVRDLKTVEPSDKTSVIFNIVESEKATDAYITEWSDKASERGKQMAKVRHNKIDRDNLKAVVFVQNKDTKQVYNTFVADVR